MKTVLFSGLAAAAMMFVGTSAGASDSSNTGTKADVSDTMDLTANGRKNVGHVSHPGVRHMRGPRPGMHGIPHNDTYRRPFRGFVMPRDWVQPSFYIPNYTVYGLSSPSRGYNWSRYYDDAVLTDSRGYVQDYRSDVDWDADNSGEGAYHEQPEYGPSMRPDAQAYDWGDDGNVAFASPDGSSYIYDGEWQGEYVDPDAQVFEGEWQGTVTRRGGVAGPGYPASPQEGPQRQARAPYPGGPAYDEGYNDHQVPQGYEGYERCLKSNGLTGAAIGAVIGGVAGNRIAGRGNRLGGTLLGAGLGGLAGVAIEKATSKCRNFEPRYQHQSRAPYQAQQYGWQGGYYYYPQAQMVSVTVVPGSSHTTVTEEVYYETVHSAPRKKAVRRWKPKPKRHCVC